MTDFIKHLEKERKKMVYSCIGYPGSKRKCIDLIMDLVPDGIEDWREPFFGSGSVSLGFLQSTKSKDCKKFIVGDLAPEIYALWKGIQKDSEKVCEIAESWWMDKVPAHSKLQSLPVDSDEYKVVWEECEKQGREFWKWAAEVDCKTLSLEERAARTWLVNRISFSSMGDSGSLSRDQLKGFKLEHLDKIREVAPLLQKLEIYNQVFQETMKDAKENTFIFLDPPYANQEKSGLYGRNGDTHHGFPHKEFAECCKKSGGRWLVTYDDSVVVRRMFRGKGIYIKPFVIQYTMAGKTAEDALAGEELFIANYDIMDNDSFNSLDGIL